jgi:hypothetical protein
MEEALLLSARKYAVEKLAKAELARHGGVVHHNQQAQA